MGHNAPMGISWGSHGAPMQCPRISWEPHKRPMRPHGFPWETHGLVSVSRGPPMGLMWVTHGRLNGFHGPPRVSHGSPMGFLYGLPQDPHGAPRGSHEMPQTFLQEKKDSNVHGPLWLGSN